MCNVQTFALREPAVRIRQKRGEKNEEAKSTSLKLGAEPKATKVALHPESLSPAEDTRTVVLFNRNHFPLALSLHWYKMSLGFFAIV